jgi:hypothetical protein
MAAVRALFPQTQQGWDDNAIDALVIALMAREELDVVKVYA